MLSRYQEVCGLLQRQPRTWLVTGVAGFIGSNLLEALLRLNQRVVGLDNFATGHLSNLNQVRQNVGEEAWDRTRILEGDIRNLDACQRAVDGVDHVLHQAALGSVPRSLEDPLTSNAVNISGTLNMLVASRDAKVDSFVYAASSATYGDHLGLPKVEDQIGRPLSPYAVTKHVNELYADVFARVYKLPAIGLRYFNVFGRRQDPDGAYAAVVPKWTAAMVQGKPIHINGDGETSRDFCYTDNVIQANILAAMAEQEAQGNVFNVAAGGRTSLNELFRAIQAELAQHGRPYSLGPIYQDFRPGDVLHSHADITKAKRLLGYAPSHTFAAGITEAVSWYLSQFAGERSIQ